ncbi:MAG TPA: hypothetical protein VMP00_15130 [Burkholderiales bacterium]|nr:hypothetical protein [Burkholderiales bacterium]
MLIAARHPAAAQRERAAAVPRPGWLPRDVRIEGGITPAQRATAIANLEQIERILLQVPELANPRGFEILPSFYGGARRLGPGQKEQPNNVIEYMLRLLFFVPTRAAGEGCTCLTVRINHGQGLGSGEIHDEQGRAIYIEMARGEPLPLATQVYEGLLRTRERRFVYVLHTSGGAPPWKTVTRAEYYNAVIFDLEGKDGAKLAEVRTAFAKTPYQEWTEGAAKRKSDREETLRTLAAMQSAAEVASLRKTMEDTEREVTERLKASEAEHRERNEKALALTDSSTGKVRAELDSMTAAQRNMPALIDGTLTEGPNATGWRMAPRDSPTAWRVLTPDYEFWRARRSPVEVRAILVNISVGGTGLVPAVHNALLNSFDKMNWSALNNLLDVPR